MYWARYYKHFDKRKHIYIGEDNINVYTLGQDNINILTKKSIHVLGQDNINDPK